MKKVNRDSFRCLLIVVFSTLLADSYLINMPPSEHKMHPGKCWDDELHQAYKVGSTNQRIPFCETALCLRDFSIQVTGCEDPSGPVFCSKIPANHSLPYPQCCAKIKCF